MRASKALGHAANRVRGLVYIYVSLSLINQLLITPL